MTPRPGTKRVHEAPANEPWMDDGLCIERMRPDLQALYAGEITPDELDRRNIFFPRRGDTKAIEEAKSICRQCLVRSECLTYALEWNIQHGIWGGTSEAERRLMRRERRKGGAA